jgi:hypothetical protein
MIAGSSRRFVVLVAGALALWAAPAGARRPPDPELNSPEAIRTLHDFGICLARNHSARSRVADVLTMDFRTEAARDAIRDLIGEHDPCVASSRVFYYVTSSNSLLFAGAIAEAFLPRDRELATLVAYDPARPPLQARSEIEVMSLCTVRAAPAAVAALFATQPVTPAEAAALRALAPQLGQCLRAGGEARVNGLEVRALLALAAWRLIAANRGAAAH